MDDAECYPEREEQLVTEIDQHDLTVSLNFNSPSPSKPYHLITSELCLKL